MVVVNTNQSENIKTIDLPIIDLKEERSKTSKLIVKACEEYGFFRVINHGVPDEVISQMEEEGLRFFEKPDSDKQKALADGPAKRYGYGCKNIGFNGDVGELEYLLLHCDTLTISDVSKSISDNPEMFSSTANAYIRAVRELGCELLELIAEGLRVQDRSAFSKMIRDVHSDSLLRVNHYPPSLTSVNSKLGFGEHSDPQILTILRSNGVSGLEISVDEGVWVPVPSEPISAFCVNVGDLLQAMTNGRFVSVKHRVMKSVKGRMSMAFFGAPALEAWVSVPTEMVSVERPRFYRAFTWGEYRSYVHSLRLSDHRRLSLFRISRDREQQQPEQEQEQEEDKSTTTGTESTDII